MINIFDSIQLHILFYIFFTTIITTALIISKPYHIKFSNDDLNGPQNFMIRLFQELADFQFFCS